MKQTILIVSIFLVWQLAAMKTFKVILLHKL